MKKLLAIISVGVALLGLCGCDSERARMEEKLIQLDMRDTTSRYSTCLEEMPGGTIKLKTRFVGRCEDIFNDSNYVHWNAAVKIGIEPLSDMRSHWQLRRPLVKIVSCEDFYVEKLTHSKPFLVPEGADMVHEIGRRFRDSLQARGGGDYRIRITSVLRTPEGVRKLRRRNSNAVDSSVHQLGTTVDISYNFFAADSRDVPRSVIDLKALLTEVLYAMRNEGKCYVKYERKQPCFHVTAIKPREQAD